MKFSFAFVLMSLYESSKYKCVPRIATKPDDISNVGNYMTEGKYDILDLKLCQYCFWIGEKNITEIVTEAVEDRNKQIIKKANEQGAIYANDFKINPDLSVLPYVKGQNVIDGNYSCPNEQLCTIQIEWDGLNNFEKKNFETTELSKTKIVLAWEYKIINKKILITHRFPGKVKRKIIYNQLATVAEGSVSVQWRKRDNEIKNIEFDHHQINVMDKVPGDDGEFKFIATVFGYFDEPLV